MIGTVIHGKGVGCRFGGDEFLAALPDLDVTQAEEIALRIHEQVQQHHFVREGITLKPGISIGVTAFPEDAADATALFEAADRAMYRAKQSGKNRVCR